MSEERLNNILLLHVHKEETDTLDLTEIAHLFVSANTRREEFFGNLHNIILYIFFFVLLTNLDVNNLITHLSAKKSKHLRS